MDNTISTSDSGTTPAFALLASIAGLFHDFGKANALFQKKLRKGKGSEPYRHEWLSCLIFLRFVGNRNDKEWLTDLTSLDSEVEQDFLEDLSPESGLQFPDSSVAQIAAWLILSHHHLPKDNMARSISLSSADSWLDSGIDVSWNSLNHQKGDFTQDDFNQVTSFPEGTPFRSASWRRAASHIATKAISNYDLLSGARLADAKLIHMARLSLMLGDYIYSSGKITPSLQDDNYLVYANTNRDSGELKQHLDEHCVGVAQCAYDVAKELNSFKDKLPHLQNVDSFTPKDTPDAFKWQEVAHQEAVFAAPSATTNGFFGVNMASTGKGKTLANARIMLGLSNKEKGARFSIALGLRTLTLQTGDSLSKLLGLTDKEIATIIGSEAIKELHGLQTQISPDTCLEGSGSESESLFDEEGYVSFNGDSNCNCISKWTCGVERVNQLLNAPITVSTIDQIISASEGISKGRQIAPLLRLLSSDLILDEVDDFSLEDTPALSRLTFFAGVMGVKVLLSSATLPPSLTVALFDSYRAGREHFTDCKDTTITCAWFDEFTSEHKVVSDAQSFRSEHNEFAELRRKNLQEQRPTQHIGEWLTTPNEQPNDNPIKTVSALVRENLEMLSKEHSTTCTSGEFKGKTVSTGIVRLANIDPLTNLAEELLSVDSPEDTRIHYCVYHSQFPLIVRSEIEKSLDSVLRCSITDHESIFSKPEIKDALRKHPEQNHVFVVLATPVAEVGRDHDYDWGIIEPSSARSVIQIAGRIQRHRKLPQTTANILVLNKNIKALSGHDVAYCHPGYESRVPYRLTKNGGKLTCLKLKDKDLTKHSTSGWLRDLDASVRYIEPEKKNMVAKGVASGLVELEHLASNLQIREHITPWINTEIAHAFGEFQNQTRFRDSQPTTEVILASEEQGEALAFHQYDKSTDSLVATHLIEFDSVEVTGARVSLWPCINPSDSLAKFSERLNMSFADTCRRFASLYIPSSTRNAWKYNDILGARRHKR